MKKILVGMMSVAAVVGCSSQMTLREKYNAEYRAGHAKAAAVPPVRVHEGSVPFKLGIAGYTFCQVSLDRALEIMKATDCHVLCHKSSFLPYTATAAEIAAYKAKLAAAGVETVASGPLYATDEKSLRNLFEFAKKMGLKTVVGVPYDNNPKIAGLKDDEARFAVLPPEEWRLESDRVLDIIDRLVKEYDIRFAIHNHGPDNAYLFPTAESALKRIGNRDKRIGVCLDIGHERRAGADPAAFIREHGDRIYDVHLKNIRIDAKYNVALPGPRGELDIPAIFKALADVGYTGACHIEYEKDFNDNLVALAESIGYYRGVMDSVKVKAKMQPVPAGANTLTAQEKAEGFELLFDGKNLPADKWVGVKEGCTNFPAKGWFVKDGAITMRPMNGIHDGQWFPLPPEDQKLAGGGDIATKKLYRDFEFRFDFRLTEAANSGVKYFYDENANKGTCEEYQVLDPAHPDSEKGRDGNRRVAALYDLIPANAEKVVKPLGQWNSGRIVSRGTKVEHWLNGVKVLSYDRASQAFRDAVQTSKYATWGTDGRRWGELEKGRILIQDHSDSTVSFCNLKVKEL